MNKSSTSSTSEEGRQRREVLQVLLAAGTSLGLDLVDVKENDGSTALHEAAEYGHIEAAALLLERGANVNALENLGNMPLHIAANQMTPVYAGLEAMIKLLLKYDADTDAKNDFGRGRVPYKLAENRGNGVASLL